MADPEGAIAAHPATGLGRRAYLGLVTACGVAVLCGSI